MHSHDLKLQNTLPVLFQWNIGLKREGVKTLEELGLKTTGVEIHDRTQEFI